MTDLLYQLDSYLKEFEATVTAVNEDYHGVILDRTAFDPGGGGQPADQGTLAWVGKEVKVTTVKRVDGQYVHVINGEDELPTAGTQVKGVVDWERRHKLMRTHTAMHILCGVIFRNYGASVTGGNMDPLEGRMDFEFETMRQELVQEIETAINKEVAAGRDIHVKILPREEAFAIPDLIRTKINLLPPAIKEVRVVEIEGLDLQADGGTHVKNTSEVGTIRVTDYKSKGKINKRIYVKIEDK